MTRREYNISIIVNQRHIEKVIIDLHYLEKHAESVTDDVNPPYTYFKTDKIELNGKRYKLIWLLDESNQMYIGVVNAYRR